MKQQALKLILLSSLMGGVGNAVAFGVDIEPRAYFGIEGQLHRSPITKKITGKYEYGEYERERLDNKPLFTKSGAGIGPFMGLSFSEYFGIECGYLWSMDKETKAILKQKTIVRPFARFDTDAYFSDLTLKQHNIYADILGYLPVLDGAVKLVGTVGLGWLHSKYQDNNYALFQNFGMHFIGRNYFNKTARKIGMRFGLGAQYEISENVSSRLMVRYQKGNEIVKNITSLGLGLFYQF